MCIRDSGRDAHSQPRLVQLEGGLELEVERVSRVAVEPMAHPEPGRRAKLGLPLGPAGQPVDGVPEPRLVDRKLVLAAPEAVAPIAQAVGPGEQELSPPVGADLGRCEAVKDRDASDNVATKGGADLGDDHLLIAVGEPELRCV